MAEKEGGLIDGVLGAGEVRERPMGIKDNLEFDDEYEAAQLGLKAGLEWVRDFG